MALLQIVPYIFVKYPFKKIHISLAPALLEIKFNLYFPLR